jgi:hypothetical protein
MSLVLTVRASHETVDLLSVDPSDGNTARQRGVDEDEKHRLRHTTDSVDIVGNEAKS